MVAWFIPLLVQAGMAAASAKAQQNQQTQASLSSMMAGGGSGGKGGQEGPQLPPDRMSQYGGLMKAMVGNRGTDGLAAGLMEGLRTKPPPPEPGSSKAYEQSLMPQQDPNNTYGGWLK